MFYRFTLRKDTAGASTHRHCFASDCGNFFVLCRIPIGIIWILDIPFVGTQYQDAISRMQPVIWQYGIFCQCYFALQPAMPFPVATQEVEVEGCYFSCALSLSLYPPPPFSSPSPTLDSFRREEVEGDSV